MAPITALRIDAESDTEALIERHSEAVAAGFDGIELTMPVPDPGAAEGGGDVSWLRARSRREGEVPAAPYDSHVRLDVVALAAGLTTTDLDTARDELVTLLDRGAGLGARCLNLTIPSTQSSDAARGFPRYQDALNFTYDLLNRCRFESERSGVPIALEVACGGCFLSPVEVRELVDAVNTWSIGACVDVPRAGVVGSPADWMATLERRVHCVRLDHAPLAETPAGKDLARALHEIHYDRPLIVQSSRPAAELRALLGDFLPAR